MSPATLDEKPDTRLDRGQHEPSRSLAQRVGSCGSRWHCAWTKPGRERLAAASIAKAGFESYLPLHLERDAWRNTTISPLFSRYVFTRFDPEHDPWGVIASCRGVCGLIRHGFDLPTTLPDAAILDLQARTSLRGIVDDPAESPWKPAGADYIPVWAPMAGMDAGARTRLLTRLFGVSVARRTMEAA